MRLYHQRQWRWPWRYNSGDDGDGDNTRNDDGGGSNENLRVSGYRLAPSRRQKRQTLELSKKASAKHSSRQSQFRFAHESITFRGAVRLTGCYLYGVCHCIVLPMLNKLLSSKLFMLLPAASPLA
jgi:hypothetical protein